MLRPKEPGDVADRQQALRTLVQNGIVALRDPVFPLIRRHADWLREWFQRHVGWSFVIDAECARLFKVPGNLADTTRGAMTPDARKAPFTRRRYAWFCLALAFLEKADRQTTLGRLAEGLGLLANEDPVFLQMEMNLDLKERDHRRDLVLVVRKLLDLGVIEKVDGDEEQFVQNRGDALYRINRARLHLLLSVRRGPSTVQETNFDQRLHAVTETMYEDTDDGRNRAIRHGINRRLVEDPIIYFSELTPEETDYFASQRAHLLRQLGEATGLIPELRREGVALADEHGSFTDFALPEEGTEGHLALLLAEHLAARYRAQPERQISVTDLEETVARLIEEYGKHWRKDAREPGAERFLLQDALARLAALSLLDWREGWVRPRPALARYAIGTIVRTSEKQGKHHE